jgi:hypothetical protein
MRPKNFDGNQLQKQEPGWHPSFTLGKIRKAPFKEHEDLLPRVKFNEADKNSHFFRDDPEKEKQDKALRELRKKVSLRSQL